jgi:hypothetical protein
MKEDILNRLDNYEGYNSHIRQCILDEAHDEIERLRGALLTIYHMNEAYGQSPTKITISLTVMQALQMKENANG